MGGVAETLFLPMDPTEGRRAVREVFFRITATGASSLPDPLFPVARGAGRDAHSTVKS
jgi:hypothetical protein